MIDHPFLDFKNLSDEELLDKTADLHRKLSKGHMWGSSHDLISQLEWMLEMIEEERMERQKKISFEALNSMFPATVESDPEFSKEKVEPSQDSNSKVVKPASKKPTSLPVPMFDKEYVTKDKNQK